MKYLLTLAAILLLAPSVSATAIVAFGTLTPARIILAADSAETIQRGDSSENGVRQVCKIRASGRWWFAVSGYTGNLDGGFDVFEAVSRALAPPQSLAAARDAIHAQALPAMLAQLDQSRGTKAFTHRYNKTGQLVADIIVAGTNAGDDTLKLGIFAIGLQAVDPLTLSATFSEPSFPFSVGVGVEGPVITLTTAPLLEWVRRGDRAAAENIIRAQMAATPRTVKGPIDVLELTARGATWALRSPSSTCAALNP